MSWPVDVRTDFQGMLVEQVRRESRRLFCTAYGVLGDIHAAEDVCQRALLKAWDEQARIREPAALRAWLTKVVVNESLQLLRRRTTDQGLIEGRAESATPGMSDAERVELREMLVAGLVELPEQTQTVVVLRLVEGLSGNEVKSLMGCSASEVSRRLYAGMEHLRRRLAPVWAAE